MKSYFFNFILISIFLSLKCDFIYNDDYPNSEDVNNINIQSIFYELTYNNYSVIKVTIKTFDEFESDISFTAYLRSVDEKKDYKLNCCHSVYDMIDCYSERNITLNLNDKFYFYYNKTNSKITLDENDIFEDDKKISLIFKPEISVNDKLYKDNRKILVETGGKMVEGGILYITKKSREILEKPKDGFNKFIELNNFISHAGLYSYRPQSTLIAFKEAIRRGFHIVDADIQFTKDKIPVIFHGEDIGTASDGNGRIDSKTLEELEKLDFGSKFDKKYAGEKIMTFECLLDLCRNNSVIIDLDLAHLDFKKYFEDTDEYMKIILNLVEKYHMIDSIFFNDGVNPETVLKLKKIRNDISVSIANMNKKENMEMVKDKYAGSKRIIFNFGGLSSGKTIDKETVKYGISLGKKIKAAKVDDLEFANKIQQWGVNYITTNKLHPFLITNTKEVPIIVRCSPVDHDTTECDIDDDILLKDNEFYNIYYTEDIYNLYENINKVPIGEFQYIDTNLLNELYYVIKKFDFSNGILKLSLSHELSKEERISGIIGPEYEDVAECYQYNFYCNGNNSHYVDCQIEKDDEDKVQFDGKYCIYSLEDYSLNEFELKEKLEEEYNDGGYLEYIVEKKISYFFVFIIIIIILIVLAILYFVKWRNENSYNAIRNTDNNYMPDDYLYR